MTGHPTRREVVAGAAVAIAAGAGPRSVAAAGVATGVVREMAAAGTSGGAPVAGVLVSNGRDVVRTDTRGHYSLPVAPGQTIFVVKPSGFRMPVDPATNLPRNAYVHDPDGTPADLGFRYAGLPPTGPLPDSVDFQLIRAPEPEKFDVVLMTDPQPESTAEIAFVRDAVVAGLLGTRAAFGMTCGDIAFDDLSMYGRINAIVGRIGIPWWTIGGNHDLDYEAADAKRSRDTYKRVFGAPYYAHEHGNALFVMLDNVEYLGAGSGKPGAAHGNYRGMVSADQLAFVEALLAATPKERLIVLVMHIPLRTYLDPTAPDRNTANAAALLALLGDRPAVSFAGHTHTTEHHYLNASNGFPGLARPHHHHVLTAASGSWWSGPLDHRGIACADSMDGSPNGFHILSIDGATYTTRFVPASEPATRQMRISLETQYHEDDREIFRTVPMAELLRSPITQGQVASTRVLVNVFDGGPRTRVAFAIDGGAPVPMAKVSRPDPFIVQVYGRHPKTIKKWVSPQNVSHLWQASLPKGLGRGTFAVELRATDEYGREHTDRMVLEIV